MEIYSILFYFFSFCFVLSAILTVIARNTIKAAMLLILCFFSAASIWLLLEAEFLAITLILVYVGAVMVLFLFVIKMLNIEKSTAKAEFIKYLPLGIIVLTIVIAQIIVILNSGIFGLDFVAEPTRHNADYSNITEIANILYTEYVYPFELAAILLLIAIIAAITLVHNKNNKSKKQNIAKQVNVQAKDRMRFAKKNYNKSKRSK